MILRYSKVMLPRIRMSASHQNGFTLIELLVAIAVLAMLMALVLGSYIHQTRKARDAKRKSDMQRLRVVLEDYYNDFDCYPPVASLSCNPGTSLRPYMAKVPCDPRTKTSYTYVPAAGACANSYWFYTKLEYLRDPEIGASGCATGCGPGNQYNFKYGSPNAQ